MILPQVHRLSSKPLDLLVGPLGLVEKDVVVDRACIALDSGVSTKVEVVLQGLSDSSFDPSSSKAMAFLSPPVFCDMMCFSTFSSVIISTR
jgi:hypothetical protein